MADKEVRIISESTWNERSLREFNHSSRPICGEEYKELVLQDSPTAFQDCSFYDKYGSTSNSTSVSEQFKNKFVGFDVGLMESFSGRLAGLPFRAGVLCIKGTIFREWHESRFLPGGTSFH